MAVYFFDTSALVKRHVTEVGSGWVRAQSAAKAGHTLYIAGITAVEMTSAITRRQRGGSLSAAQTLRTGTVNSTPRPNLLDCVDLTPPSSCSITVTAATPCRSQRHI